MTRPRLRWLDIAKGIAIILVVFGHVLSSYSNSGLLAKEGYLKFIANFFSSFSMPFFFFAAGLVFAERGDREASLGRQLSRRFLAYFIPYLACTLVLWGLKRVAGPLVNNQVGEISLRGLFVYPLGYLWFLYALMLGQMLAILLEKARLPRPVILALSLAMLLVSRVCADVPGITNSVLSDLMRHFLFFCVGFCLRGPVLRLVENARWGQVLLGLALLAGLSVLRFFRVVEQNALYAALLLLQGCAGVYTLSALSARVGRSRPLEYLGSRTLPVYLMHCVVVAAMRVALTKLGLPLGTGWLHMLPCTAVGTLFPLLVYGLCAKVKWLDFWFYPMRYIRLGGKDNGRATGAAGA